MLHSQIWKIILVKATIIIIIIITITIIYILAERLRNFSIEVFCNDPLKFANEEPQICGTHPEAAGANVIVECQLGVRGRFVKITLYNASPLTLCEVQVYGTRLSKEGI